MSRSAERVLHKFFGFYTTKLGHRRRHNSIFRSLEKVNGIFGFWRENLRMDPLIFHSSSAMYGRDPDHAPNRFFFYEKQVLNMVQGDAINSHVLKSPKVYPMKTIF